MKRFILYIMVLTMVMVVPQSCSDDYLDLFPTEQISDADVFTTTKNAWASINGIHRFMFSQFWGRQSHAGQSGFMIGVDQMGEDIANLSRGTGWHFSLHNWIGHRVETNIETFLPYRFYFQIIANANMIIKNIDGAVGPLAEREQIKGQALAYRGWAFHQLVQFYGRRYDWTNKPNTQLGVPLVLEPTLEGLPRATVEEVYTQINTDLNDAAVLLLGKTPPAANPKSHITHRVVLGMQARVALTQGDWPRAAQLANQARQGAALMTSTSLTSGMNSRALPEFLWCSHVQEDQTTFFFSFFAYMSWNFSSGWVRANPRRITNTLYNRLSDTDTRKLWWARDVATARVIQANTAFTVAQHMSVKFAAVGAADSRGDVPYMRTAELFLIEAEALARQGGQDVQARQMLFNLVSTRDPAYTLSVNSGDALIEEIMFHRRIELWGEGFRWFDLKRLNMDMDRRGANHIEAVATTMFQPAGTNEWVFKIHHDELNANPNVVQND